MEGRLSSSTGVMVSAMRWLAYRTELTDGGVVVEGRIAVLSCRWWSL